MPKQVYLAVLRPVGCGAMSAAALRLTDAQEEAQRLPAMLSTEVAAQALAAEAALRQQIDALGDELDALRRRDETRRYHLHRVDEELRLAARLQQDFLPKFLPTLGPVRFHTLFRPASHVSGDIYDVMRLDETHVGFYIVDAVGHGMPAALLTMFLKNALVTKEIRPDGYRLLEPSRTMARLNDALVQQNLSNATFATALYGHIDVKTLRVTFARGGHPNPVLLTRAGELKTFEAEGSLLGIFPEEQYAETTLQLAPGDRLFIYSDGLELAFTDEGNLDADRWRQTLRESAGRSTAELVEAFQKQLDRTADAQRQKDDLTVVVVEVQDSSDVQDPPVKRPS
jgi:sigma-B regulation protein RsbU (phosphoserine phosphatase)